MTGQTIIPTAPTVGALTMALPDLIASRLLPTCAVEMKSRFWSEIRLAPLAVATSTRTLYAQFTEFLYSSMQTSPGAESILMIWHIRRGM